MIAPWLLVWPALAHAHPLGFAVLDLRPSEDGAVHYELTISPEEGEAADALALDFPGCEARELGRQRTGEGEVRRGEVRCPGALEVELRGMSAELSVLVRDARGGEPMLRRMDAARARLALDEGSGWASLVRLGAEHAGTGVDHLLFLLGLVLLAGAALRPVALAVTGFTLGHLTSLSAGSLLGLPADVPTVELLIALSLVALATELVHRDPARPSLGVRRPAGYALGFGLVHGLGFASALGSTGLGLGDRLRTLAGFHVGIELVQLALVVPLVLAAPALRRAFALERAAAYVVGSVGVALVLSRL